MVSTLLVVDDEPAICWGLSRLAESMGHRAHVASSAEQALVEVSAHRPDVIILDVRLPGMDGISAIEQFRHRGIEAPIIVITAYGDLPTAVDAIRQGAFDYVAKPFDLAKVKGTLLRAFGSGAAAGGPSQEILPQGLNGLVGRSPVMQEVYKQIALAASSDASTLLTGESGTGKELAARAIHRYSARSAGPFVAVNVAALSPSLAESELFGHVRGAFTGADAARTGLLVQADGGTLFLDEVADIPLATQVKLLRALELGEVVPVGASEPLKTDFRVIAATHRNLLALVSQGSFRHDLFYRLGAFQISLPALRERGEDIALLAQYFAQSLGDGGRPTAISQSAIDELNRRRWRGNVRELRNAMASASILARGGVILPEHLPQEAALSETAPPTDDSAISHLIESWVERTSTSAKATGQLYEQFLSVVEPPLLSAILERHQGQCASAARALGIHRTTLRKKLIEHGLSEGAVGGDES